MYVCMYVWVTLSQITCDKSFIGTPSFEDA